jgi:hypothetical protein
MERREMDEHAFEKMNRTLDALVEEHLPQEVIIAWTEEALVEMGFPGFPPRQEDIPDEVDFRVRQRMLQYLAERASEPLTTWLRETYRYNAQTS